MTYEELLDLIIDRAPKLRAVGVTSVGVDGLSITLADLPPQPSEAKPGDQADDDDDLNPLEDPTTFGRSSKRKAPSFRGGE